MCGYSRGTWLVQRARSPVDRPQRPGHVGRSADCCGRCFPGRRRLPRSPRRRPYLADSGSLRRSDATRTAKHKASRAPGPTSPEPSARRASPHELSPGSPGATEDLGVAEASGALVLGLPRRARPRAALVHARPPCLDDGHGTPSRTSFRDPDNVGRQGSRGRLLPRFRRTADSSEGLMPRAMSPSGSCSSCRPDGAREPRSSWHDGKDVHSKRRDADSVGRQRVHGVASFQFPSHR